MRLLSTVVTAIGLVIMLMIAGCTGPPPLVDDESTTPTTPANDQVNELIVGVDDLSGGFNPHTMADLNSVPAMVADLVLPSVFTQQQGGGWALNRALMDSAEVTSREPFTVTYQIRRDAAWSDTAPIAAEDFVYLADNMRTRPGVINPAGYQLISDIRSGGGGKTVEVVFSRPYPAWQSLFQNLLPAHLLKDAPGGWEAALDDGIPASGGPFAVHTVDPARAELELVRNDRFWDTPALLDRLVLREDTQAGLLDSLAGGGLQAVLFRRPDAITNRMLDERQVETTDPPSETTVVPQPVVTRLLLRPAGETLRDDRVRTAVAAALDRNALIAVGAAGGPAAGLEANAQAVPPAAEAYVPTAPPSWPGHAPDPELTRRLLTEAGYVNTGDGWRRGNQPLEIVVGAPDTEGREEVLATRVAAQLEAAGIRARVVVQDPDVFYGRSLAESNDGGSPGVTRPSEPARDGGVQQPAGGVDIAVIAGYAGNEPATTMASLMGCPMAVPAGQPLPQPNPAGFCDVQLQPAIEAALTGTADPAAVRAQIEPALWQAAVSIPLYQRASIMVTGSDVSGIAPGSLLQGPFTDADQWTVD